MYTSCSSALSQYRFFRICQIIHSILLHIHSNFSSFAVREYDADNERPTNFSRSSCKLFSNLKSLYSPSKNFPKPSYFLKQLPLKQVKFSQYFFKISAFPFTMSLSLPMLFQIRTALPSFFKTRLHSVLNFPRQTNEMLVPPSQNQCFYFQATYFQPFR